MKITKRQLRKIIREAIYRQPKQSSVGGRKDYMQALERQIPDDFEEVAGEDAAAMMMQYRDEWFKLQRKVATMGADDPEAWNAGLNTPPDPSDPYAWEHKSVQELEGPYELQRGIQGRMDYLIDHMKDLWNEYEEYR